MVGEWRCIQEEEAGGAGGAGGEDVDRGIAVLAVSVLGTEPVLNTMSVLRWGGMSRSV